MKYYLYISDAKVDMLLPQVTHKAEKKTSTELGFDLKVLSAKYKVKRRQIPIVSIGLRLSWISSANTEISEP
jgi:hypothetical protein